MADEKPIDLGGGDTLPPLPGPLAPTEEEPPQLVTVYVAITAWCLTGPAGAGIRQRVTFSVAVDVLSDEPIESILLRAEEVAMEMKPDCEIEESTIIAPLYYFYARGV